MFKYLVLSWTFLLIAGLSLGMSTTTTLAGPPGFPSGPLWSPSGPKWAGGPLWSQDPIVKDGWYYGYPSEEPIIIFCNDTNPIECPVVPPKAKTFAQLIGTINGGEYWMTMLVDLEPPTNAPTNYTLELLDFGVVVENNVNITISDAVLISSMDVIWFSNYITLNSPMEWQNVRFNFHNHSGPIKNINIQYLVNDYIGPPIRVVFRGVALYWY